MTKAEAGAGQHCGGSASDIKDRMFAIAAAVGLISASPADQRATDAVSAFSDLCVSLFTGEPSDVDPSRFSVTKLPPQTVKKIKPNLAKQTVWDVSGTQSDVHMLVHYDPIGVCVVEVAAADEEAIRANYASLSTRWAKN